jgi:RHS repeat-associated protein
MIIAYLAKFLVKDSTGQGILNNLSLFDNVFFFGGVYYDAEIETYWMRHRYYHPVLRKFLSRDPLADDSLFNLYAAFENNPGVFRDPMGLDEWFQNWHYSKAILGIGWDVSSAVVGTAARETTYAVANLELSIYSYIMNEDVQLFGESGDALQTLGRHSGSVPGVYGTMALGVGQSFFSDMTTSHLAKLYDTLTKFENGQIGLGELESQFSDTTLKEIGKFLFLQNAGKTLDPKRLKNLKENIKNILKKEANNDPCVKPNCFVAGTLILANGMLIHIENIQILEEVDSDSLVNLSESTLSDLQEITPQSHRVLELRLEKADGSLVQVLLVRSLSWIETEKAELHRSLFLDLPEMGVRENAKVVSISECSADSRLLSTGKRLVTGIFIHENAKVFDLYFEALEKPIGVTASHPFYSLSRNTWVSAGQLYPSELVKTKDGSATFLYKKARAGGFIASITLKFIGITIIMSPNTSSWCIIIVLKTIKQK